MDESFVQAQILLGECHVHMGNFLDTDAVSENGNSEEETAESDEESIAHYKKAVECFQYVQKIQPGSLPDQFEEFLNEWMQDLA